MKTQLRRKIWQLLFGYRRYSFLLPVLTWVCLVSVSWRLSVVISRVLLPPSPPYDQDLGHFRRSRSLKHYLDNIQLLIEPSTLPCSNLEEVPVIALVSSAPSRLDQRDAIRLTWGRHFPTYFILGLDGRNEDQLIDNYVEAKLHGDLVVYDFKDHYQNLTLKTGLMLQWTRLRCPQTHFLYKTDDDMLVNPWVLKDVLKERGEDAYMLGYVFNNSWLHRDEHNKWYLPRWLSSEDLIPQYITGPGYLISGDYIQEILNTANRVPLHNMEDVYFTYNVAKKTLRYELRHDPRLSPYRPWPLWLPASCAYWKYASLHSLSARDILRIWSYIHRLGEQHAKGETVCQFYSGWIIFTIE